MNKSNNATKYFAYVRKSTEEEERQALSISSQMDKVKEFFSALDIVEVLEEKHSAFKPYNRPVFENMIKRIRKGEASGIIAWHPDRLSRNEIDASTITYLVRTGVIKDLKFGSYSFDNSPEGIMMLQMSLSQSQYFSSKLGKDVRRGLEKKFNMGWQPNMAPNGYLNIMLKDKGYRIIKVDKKRFDCLRKAFDMMLTGNYSVPQVLNKLNDDWNFKTRIRKGGLTRSSLYRIFTNPFYAGIIEYNGKQKIGKHKAMITLAEYDRIQILLGKKGRPRIRKNVFAYSGLIRCANCGSLISADKKVKYIKALKKEKTYIYYRCNRKKPNIKCTEQAISENVLKEQVNKMLDSYDVIPEFAQLYDEIVKDCKEESPKDQQRVLENIRRKISNLKIEKASLTQLACKGLLSDDEFLEQKNNYEKQIIHQEQKVLDIAKGKNDKDEILDNISLMMRAKKRFQIGSEEERKEIVRLLGSNRVLSDRSLLISANKWGGYFEMVAKPYADDFATLELNKTPLNTKQNEALTSLCCELRNGRVSLPGLGGAQVHIASPFSPRPFQH